MQKDMILTRKVIEKKNKRVITVRIEKELLSEIEVLCTETGRSRNEVVNLLLEYAVRHSVVEQ